MNSAPEIPREALDIHYNNRGFLLHVGLHRRNGVFYQESSYSHFAFFGVMMAAAIVALVLPSNVWPAASNLKYLLAGILVWGALCGLVPYFVRNAFGQIITIDPQKKRLSIASRDFNATVLWSQVIGLQVCRQKVPGSSGLNGFQLNLAWSNEKGAVQRHCLLKHAARAFVVRLGKRYESSFGFPLIDHSASAKKTQPMRRASH